jgi:CRP/FNR family transcriptional regulator, cyclic AMP receptor protein
VNFTDRDSLHENDGISREFPSAYRDIHELVLACSSEGKLARLLLSCTGGQERENRKSAIRIRSSLTHEEMAQMTRSSRETVTRVLSLKKKQLIRLESSTLVICNRPALEGCMTLQSSREGRPFLRPPPPRL